MQRFSIHHPVLLAALLALLAAPRTQAQPTTAFEVSTTPLTLTLDEALQIALVQNYTVRDARLDVDNARAQVREAWGQVMPQIDASSSYTRNLKSPNPFAGSDAGGLFGSLGFVGWLAYNEDARVDDDPATVPITFDEYSDRRSTGLSDAGFVASGNDNPFAVPNQFQNGVTVTQTLFNGSAYAAIAGAERLKELNQRAADRQEQLIIDGVRQAFYQALLAQAQADVSAQSVTRVQATVQEVSKRVERGTAPKFQRLSAEVEQANLETQYVQARNQAHLTIDNLKFTLGIPMEQPVRLRGELDADNLGRFTNVAVDDVIAQAIERRPDVAQARLAVELRRIDKNIARAQYFPILNAFANFSYTGSVPDNRTNFFENRETDDPFDFRRQDNTFFSTDYWNPGVNVGVRLTWNIFNGFQTTARMQQRQVAVEKAQVQYEQLTQSVRLEVAQALRNLEAARIRIDSQLQNVDRAELNYEYADARIREGVSSQLELREASDQLDLSRLNYLQAVYDYLVARSAFETALGVPLLEQSEFRLTSN